MRRIDALALGMAGSLVLFEPLACRKASQSSASASSIAKTPAQKAEKKVAYWYDPMKPEVHFDHAGKSPFMDMELVPKYVEETPVPASHPAEKKILYWYDPMHPQYRSDRPGKSPDCGMDMVPKYAEGEPSAQVAASAPPGYSVVRIPLERRQEIGVTTAKVEKRPIGGTLQTNGVIAEDEARIYAVNAKFGGYLERLLVDRTGQAVRRGQPLLTVYSPDLVATERELLLAEERAALAGLVEFGGGGGCAKPSLRHPAASPTLGHSRFRDRPDPEERKDFEDSDTRVSGLGDRCEEGCRRGHGDHTRDVALHDRGPFGRVGPRGSLSVRAREGRGGDGGHHLGSVLGWESLRGRVDFIYPTLSEETRTGKVRVVVPNSKTLLKPGMFVRVSLPGGRREALAVPRSAVLETGERQIAFVEQSPGVYAPREVKVGTSEGDFVEVLSGLAAGETVVTSANFLIDSESRIGGMGTAPAGSAGQPAQPLGHKSDGPR